MSRERDVHIFEGGELLDAVQANLLAIEADETPQEGQVQKPASPSAKKVARKLGRGSVQARRYDARRGAKIRDAIKSAITNLSDDSLVLVLEDLDPKVKESLRKLATLVPGIVEKRERELTEKNIEDLVSVYMPDVSDFQMGERMLERNARARTKFLEEWYCLTSKQVAEQAGHTASNESMTSSRWKKANRIFSVNHAGKELFPAFQLQDGQPHPTVVEVLEKIGKLKSGWQLAFWFTYANSWLGGRRPADMLSEKEQVVEAAREASEAVIG